VNVAQDKSDGVRCVAETVPFPGINQETSHPAHPARIMTSILVTDDPGAEVRHRRLQAASCRKEEDGLRCRSRLQKLVSHHDTPSLKTPPKCVSPPVRDSLALVCVWLFRGVKIVLLKEIVLPETSSNEMSCKLCACHVIVVMDPRDVHCPQPCFHANRPDQCLIQGCRSTKSPDCL